MLKIARAVVEQLLQGVGDGDHMFEERGITAIHVRKAMTDADAASLKHRPIWEQEGINAGPR